MTDPDLRVEKAAAILDHWASALRGDWGSIDGRTCRDELNRVSEFLRGERETLTLDDVGVCIEGEYGAHWQQPSAGYHDGKSCFDIARGTPDFESGR